MFVVLVPFTEPPRNWSTGAALSTPLSAMIPPEALADVAPQLHVYVAGSAAPATFQNVWLAFALRVVLTQRRPSRRGRGPARGGDRCDSSTATNRDLRDQEVVLDDARGLRDHEGRRTAGVVSTAGGNVGDSRVDHVRQRQVRVVDTKLEQPAAPVAR